MKPVGCGKHILRRVDEPGPNTNKPPKRLSHACLIVEPRFADNPRAYRPKRGMPVAPD
jgi:hypothetical protein